MRAVFFNRIGFKLIVVQFFQPSVFVRREYAVGSADLREHFVLFKNHRVFERMKADVALHERVADCQIASDGVRLVVIVGENGIYCKFTRQSRNHFIGARMANHQSAAQCLQCCTQFANTFPNELDAPVLPVGQGIENCAIKYKYAVHAPGGFQGMIKTRIVGCAQITAEPEQGGIQL